MGWGVEEQSPGLVSAVMLYDTPPLEAPDAKIGWSTALRLTGRLRGAREA